MQKINLQISLTTEDKPVWNTKFGYYCIEFIEYLFRKFELKFGIFAKKTYFAAE
ncbi:hypothetical protein PJIAN_3307 [Paludibacter jiangxiensis]|uniref:Uncharacterized protein n=1 Tax=Paludibacter jiangxiensis TaxID=681398 RepID=A0A161LEF7_9BACT|nr:hypothetical protein PJIAN_3307 [Paludibacter jiangxiensis]